MVQMQLPQIKERVNATYGYAAISRLHLTQTAPTGFTKEQAKLDVKQPMKRRIAPIKKAELKSNISNVSDEGLRTALAMLGENILTKLQK